VNWNSTGYLRQSIASIYRFTQGLSFEIIVVDNASPIQDLDGLVEHFPAVTVIKSPQNLGFARANNVGFERSSGEFILFLNPDTELEGPAINIMLNRLKALANAGIMGCRLLNTDHSLQTSCIQSFPTILNQLLDVEFLRSRWPNSDLWGIAPLFSISKEANPVQAISGACMMLHREAFKSAGKFSEDYFMYAEDLDLCYKVAKAGFTNYYIGEAIVIHHGGKSSRQRAVDQWATIMKFKAVQHFCSKTRGRVYGVVYQAAMGCSAVGRLLLIYLVFPFALIRLKPGAVLASSAKWSAVLRWALGLGKTATEAARS
jgi:GT2 family glycosyltransferase